MGVKAGQDRAVLIVNRALVVRVQLTTGYVYEVRPGSLHNHEAMNAVSFVVAGTDRVALVYRDQVASLEYDPGVQL